MANLFYVRQREGELLKEYLNRFCAVSVRIQNPNEEMVVDVFVNPGDTLQCGVWNGCYESNRNIGMLPVSAELLRGDIQ